MMNEDSSEEDFTSDESEESGKGSSSGSESSQDEIIRQYKTRSRRNENGDEEVAEATKEKRWYHEFMSDEDRYRLDLSGKMVLLMEILKECEAIGDKVVLFSQSLLTLNIIEDFLTNIDKELLEENKARVVSCGWTKGLDYFRMDGSTSAEKRKQYIDMFNSPDNYRARLFLVSTKAGGLGTNLVGANRVVMLDASWNPSQDVQAIFRVYRFGQKKPVYIYRLLAEGTIEEKVYDRQVTKLSLSIRVIDEQQIDHHFSASELAELYNYNPNSITNRPTPLVPKDTLLADMLMKFKDWIVAYHEHDSLLQNENEEDLTEEERQAAWKDYEDEKDGRTLLENNADEDMLKNQMYGKEPELSEYAKEPDYTQADYEGTMIPPSKELLESIISSIYPTSKLPKIPSTRKRRKRCGECPGCLQKENCGSCAQCTRIGLKSICRMRGCHFLQGRENVPARKRRKRCGECPGCLQKENCGSCAQCTHIGRWKCTCRMRRCQSLQERGNKNIQDMTEEEKALDRSLTEQERIARNQKRRERYLELKKMTQLYMQKEKEKKESCVNAKKKAPVSEGGGGENMLNIAVAKCSEKLDRIKEELVKCEEVKQKARGLKR